MGKWLLLGGCGLLLLVSGISQSQQAMAQSPAATPTLVPSGSPPVITPDNVADLGIAATLSRGIADRVFWTEDGQHLIVASDSGFWLHDLNDLQASPHQMGEPGSVLFSAVISADRKTLVWAHGRQGTSMDAATGQIRASVTELGYEGSSVGSVALSPDSSLLVANAQSVGLYLVDRNGQTKSPDFYSPIGFITPDAEAFSPNNRLLVVADNDKLHIWQTEDFAPGDLKLPVDGALSVSFNQDGTRLAVGYEDGSIAIGDMAARNPYVKLSGRRSPVKIVTFAPQGDLLVGVHANGAAELWKLDARELLLTIDARGEPDTVVFSPDGKQLAIDANWYPGQSQTQLWDIPSGTRRAVLKNATYPAFKPDGKMIATIYRDTVALWDTATGRLLYVLAGYNSYLTHLIVSPSGRFMAVIDWYKNPVLVRNVQTGSDYAILDVTAPYDIAFGADDYTLATVGADNIIRLWDLKTKQARRKFTAGSTVNSLALSRDGQWLAAAQRGLSVWEVATGRRFQLGKENYALLSWSADNKHLAAMTSEGEVQIWDAATRALQQKWQGYMPPANTYGWPAGIAYLAYSMSGDRLIYPRNFQIIVFRDLISNKPDIEVTCRDSSFTQFAFSPDLGLVISSCINGAYEVYTSIARLVENPDQGLDLSGAIYSFIEDTGGLCAFTPDGTRLIIGNGSALWLMTVQAK